MARIIAASCVNGQVTVEGVAIEAEILSAGVASSQGVVILQDDNVWYVATNSVDLQSVIEKTAELVNLCATLFTSIGAGMTGPTTAPPPTLAVDVLNIQTKASVLDALKDNLR